MKNSILVIFSSLIIFALSSCHSSKSISGQLENNREMLYQYKWYFSELDSTPYKFLGKSNETSWLLFKEGNPSNVSGFTGCNSVMGSVEVKDNSTMKFLPLASTRMFCPGNEEAALLKALSLVTTYNIADTQLVLRNGNTVLAKLNGVSPEMERLSGTWELNYISGPKNSFEGLYPDKKPTIIFNFSAKQLMGNTSCNGFSSKYSINGNHVSFADQIQTMMFCGGTGEQTFLSMLKKVNRYSLNNNTLTFLMDDLALMRFANQPDETQNK